MEKEGIETMKADIVANIDAAISVLKENREAVQHASNARHLEIYRTLSRHDVDTLKEERDIIA